MPILCVIAGPNGVGKTTFADAHLPHTIRQFEFVNADSIARGLSPYNPDGAAVEAGRIALKRIRELIAKGQSFTWETTLSGRSALRWLSYARQLGYETKCYFLWVRSVRVLLARIQQRVAEGGHDIPREISERRFFKTFENLLSLYLAHFDSVKVDDNSSSPPRLILIQKHGRLVIRDRKQWENILAQTGLTL